MGLSGIDSHTGVVAHMAMGTRGKIKERGLATVGVSHQGDIDHAALLHGLMPDIVVLVDAGIFSQREVRGLNGGIGRHHLDIVSLLMTQTDLIAHQLVLHGILQRRIEQHFHFRTLDESHLDDTLAESTMTQHLDDDTFLACL